jgi:hypothetical protein
MRTTIVVFSIYAFAAAGVAQTPATPKTVGDSVRAVETARGQALLRADTVELSRLMAPEFFEISRLGQSGRERRTFRRSPRATSS